MTDHATSGRSAITVTATSRPKRVAFLLDPEKTTVHDVDVVTQFAVRQWGGGYYPLIPTNGSDLARDYWRLLAASDPDVVYPLSDIDETLANRIQVEIGPAVMDTFDERRRSDERLWIDPRHTSALGVLDIPRAMAARRRSILPHSFLYLTAMGESDSRTFVLRNFGLLDEVVSTKEAFGQLPIQPVEMDSTDVGTLLTLMTSQHSHQLVTPRHLSTSFMTPPFRPKHDSFGQSFHLVVGDSIHDALYAWNRQQVSTRWKGQDFLWLPTSSITDKALLEVVGKWIARFYWDNQQKHGYVVSFSLDEATLDSVGMEVSKTAWMPLKGKRMPTEQFPITGVEPQWEGPFEDPPPTAHQQIALHDDKGLVSIPAPRFVRSRHRSETDGWMVDLNIEYHLDSNRYWNQADYWRLPRRATVAMRLIQPTMKATQQRVCTVSSQGEKLAGLIGLAGSLGAAGSLFEDAYARELLLGLAGSSEGHTRSQVIRVQNLLKKFDNEGDSLSDQGKSTELARRIVDKIAHFSEPTPSVSWEDCKRIFSEVKASDEGKDALANDSFDEFRVRQLEELVESTIFIQGALLDCPHCGTKNWRTVDAVSPQIKCDGCVQSFAFSPTASWLFRLNELVSNAIDKSGILAVLHALVQLERWAHDFFLYLPCQDLYEDRGDGRYERVTDLDLVVVQDGRFIIGEVKSSAEGFLEYNFERLIELALEIRPAKVVFAATGTKWPDTVGAHFAEVKKRLEPDVEVEAILVDW